jgi:hypothetical protein
MFFGENDVIHEVGGEAPSVPRRPSPVVREEVPRPRACEVLLLAALACCAAACTETKEADRAPVVGTAASQQGTSGGVAAFDGDAYDDLFAGAPFAVGDDTLGAVFVYRGTATGFAETPTWTLTGGDNFGSSFAAVGDVDGDGRGDYAVGAVNGDGPDASLSGTVTVFRGGSSGQVLRTVGGEQALDKFGTSITGGCDLDADGHADLVVGAPSHSPGPDRYLGGAYYVYFGPQLADATRAKLPATLDTGILGFSSACGDVNGDGVDDLVTSAIWTHGVIWHASKVLVHYGGAGFAPDADAADVTIASTASHFGDALAVLDDLDGDGFREVAIGVPSFYAIPAPSASNPMNSLKGRVFLVKGGAGTRTVNLSPPPGTPIPDLLTTITGGDYLERFGTSVAPVGDLDADGKPDFAVGAPHGHAAGATSLDTGWVTGKVYLFLGKNVATTGAGTSAPAAATATSGAGRTLHYGSFLAPFERGGPRLLVGAPGANRQSGTVFVQDISTAAP